MQFYLGSQRLQLEHKGDEGHAYASFGQVVVAFAGFTIPIIAWLLDKKGYGVTLGTINAISVLSGALMAIPWLWIQSLTLTLWMVGRFFMYSSYFVRYEVEICARALAVFSLDPTLVSSLARPSLGLSSASRTLASWLPSTTLSTACLVCSNFR